MAIDCNVWLFFLMCGSCFGAKPKSADLSASAQLPKSVIEACWNGNAQWIEAFLDEGGDPNAIDGTGLTLFARACARGNVKVVQTLLSHKNFDRTLSLELMSEGKTPLMWASWTGKKDVVRLLAQQKINLERQDEQGCTALILAAQEQELDCVQTLLQAGAKIDARDYSGFTARKYAQTKNYHSVIALLNRYKKNQKQELQKKRSAEKEGFELMQPLDEDELKDLEKQNAPAVWSWCAIQ